MVLQIFCSVKVITNLRTNAATELWLAPLNKNKSTSRLKNTFLEQLLCGGLVRWS